MVQNVLDLLIFNLELKMAIPPLLIKLGVKVIAQQAAKKLLTKSVENGESRMAKLSNSLLPSDNEYLKGRNVASKDLPLSAMYAVLHGTLLSANKDRIFGCAKNPDKVVPFDLESPIIDIIERNLGEGSKQKFAPVFRALENTPFAQATSGDLRDALIEAGKKISSNPNQQNLSTIVNRNISGSVASAIAERAPTSLTEGELKAMSEGHNSFSRFHERPVDGTENMRERPDMSI